MAARDADKPLVLVADGDRQVRSMVRMALGDAGYPVVEAADGDEAVAATRTHRPGLVVLDADLPGAGGAATCREIRRRHADAPTPILVVTHPDDPGSVAEAYEAGASDFLTKPIDWPGFVHRIRFLVRHSRAFSGLRRDQISLVNAQRLARLGSFELHYASRSMRWSDELFRILGLDPATAGADPKRWWSHVHPADRDRVRAEAKEALEHEGAYVIEHRVVTPDGRVRHVRQQAELVMGPGDDERWLVGTLQDVTEQRLASRQIWYLANFDHLTGLANRNYFHDRFEESIARARRSTKHVAVLYLDLDDFKRVNDTLGHSAGDVLLRQVGDRLRARVRDTDIVGRPSNEEGEPTVSRLGGDEFTVLVSDVGSPDEVADVARRVLEDLGRPVPIEGQEVVVSGSIGIALFPNDGEDVETLMKCADTAMYQAKERGRNGYQFFSPSMTERLMRRLHVERRLREALRSGGLHLRYQPKILLGTRAPSGLEALLRWEDPELGSVSPKEIIPVAEESGLIHELGRWVVEEACRTAAAWQAAGLPPLPVAVNVSPMQFAGEDAREQVSRALRESGLQPSRLELEITETVLMQDDDRVALQLRDLRAMGVRVALDDFGTGYSSLSYLTRFPLDALKLDRCFTRDVDSDPGAEGVVRAVVQIAHSLGLRVVAEGVDDEGQARVLRQVGCDEAQGFLFSGSLDPADAARFLRGEPGPR